VEEISCSQVRLTGLTTDEVVTITWNADDDATYSSSTTGHATGTVYGNPTSCPNEAPDWFTEFLYDNANAPVPKRAAPAFPAMKLPKLRLFR
jgi:hypothetical protein